MITGDLASRLRIILEANVQAVAPVHELAGEVPEFQSGERFRALIQGPLPDGSYRALVAGRLITLSLSEFVKSGDSLELQVTERRGEVIHARRAPDGSLPTGASSDQPKAVLSQAGQIISQLLTGRHGEARPLPLNPAQNTALLDTRSPNPAELAPMLRQAIKQSGMFYESHLRQWVEGKLPLSSLLAEPQAQQAPLASPGNTSALPQAAANALPETHLPSPQADATAPEKTALNPRLSSSLQAASALHGQTSPPAEEAAASRNTTSNAAEASGKSVSGRVAEALTPVVLQQLEAISSNQLGWQGQILPGMQLQWSLINPDEHSQSSGPDQEDAVWRSNLRVELPNLGGIQARLTLGSQGLSLSLDTSNSTSADQMRANQASLFEALAAAGIPLLQMKVSEHVRA